MALATLDVSVLGAALLGAVAYGSGDFVGGRAALRLSTAGAVAIAQCVAVLLLVKTAVVEGAAFPAVAGSLRSVLGGCAYALGLLCLYRGLAVGRIAVVAPLCGILSVLITLAGDVALERVVTSWLLLGVGLCGLAAVLIATAGGAVAPRDGLAFSVRMGLLSGLGFGVADVCLGAMPTDEATGGLLVARAVAAAIALFCLLAPAGDRSEPAGDGTVRHAPRPRTGQVEARSWLPWPLLVGVLLAVGAGLLDAVGHMGYVHAATRGSMGVAAALVGLFPAISVLLAVLILRERILGRQYAGLATGGVGVIALSV